MTWSSSWLWGQPEERLEETRVVEAPATPVSWTGQFPMKRGGTVVFTLTATSAFSIAILSATGRPEGGEAAQPWVGVRVGKERAELVYAKGDGYSHKILASSSHQGVGYGTSGACRTCWLSFDQDNRTVKFGHGSRMLECTYLEYVFQGSGLDLFGQRERDSIAELFDIHPKAIQLHNYGGPPVVESSVFEAPLVAPRLHQVSNVSFDDTPLLLDPSPRLLEDHQMLLSDFTQEDFTFPSSLSPVLQTLANQVMQPNLSLEAAGHGDNLAAAIRHSLTTPGATLHTRLQEKVRRLPKGAPETSVQLSVALAPCNGTSPGPPVTLEVLPPGHCSLPHDNARANGVLRVLHGMLDVCLHRDDLGSVEDAVPLDEVELDRGDAMWFSPTWYQTHAMRNDSAGFCCYLLARRYSEDDEVRWPFIQSRREDGSMSSSPVEVDFQYKEFQALVLAELEAALEQNPALLENTLDINRASSLRTEAWLEVDRTDSAMDYAREAFQAEISKAAEGAERKEADLKHRLGCGLFRAKAKDPISELQTPRRYLLPSLTIDEETTDKMTTMWP